jgi:hypothetical protein
MLEHLCTGHHHLCGGLTAATASDADLSTGFQEMVRSSGPPECLEYFSFMLHALTTSLSFSVLLGAFLGVERLKNATQFSRFCLNFGCSGDRLDIGS